MNGAPRRSTSRIARELPPEVREQLHDRLSDGRYTYDDVVEWLDEVGYDISRSSVARYGKGFMARLAALRQRREQAAAIVDDARGKGLELHEAANTIAVDMITGALMSADGFKGMEPDKLLKMLAALQTAQVRQAEYRAKADRMLTTAEERIKAAVRDELKADPDLADRVAAVVSRAAAELRSE
jgi:hypothetical protein